MDGQLHLRQVAQYPSASQGQRHTRRPKGQPLSHVSVSPSTRGWPARAVFQSTCIRPSDRRR